MRLTKSGVVTELQQFTNTIEKAYSQALIIYATQEAYKAFIRGNFPNQIWRDIGGEPTFEDRKNWTFWQYARAYIKGINGFVDLNAFEGDRSHFHQLLSN